MPVAPAPLLWALSLIFGKIQTVPCNISLTRAILLLLLPTQHPGSIRQSTEGTRSGAQT